MYQKVATTATFSYHTSCKPLNDKGNRDCDKRSCEGIQTVHVNETFVEAFNISGGEEHDNHDMAIQKYKLYDVINRACREPCDNCCAWIIDKGAHKTAVVGRFVFAMTQNARGWYGKREAGAVVNCADGTTHIVPAPNLGYPAGGAMRPLPSLSMPANGMEHNLFSSVVVDKEECSTLQNYRVNFVGYT